MLANLNQVLEFIPQRPPMVMVDALLTQDGQTTVSQLQLSPDNLFCDGGFFREAGIVENMAQTAALGTGYAAKQSGEPAGTGFIGSLKRVEIHRLPRDTDRLETEVTVLHRLLNATVIRAEVRVDDHPVATGEMNIFLQQES